MGWLGIRTVIYFLCYSNGYYSDRGMDLEHLTIGNEAWEWGEGDNSPFSVLSCKTTIWACFLRSSLFLSSLSFHQSKQTGLFIEMKW